MSAHPHLSGRAENDRMLDLASTGRLSCLFVLSGGAQERTPKPHEQRVSSCLGKNLKFPQKPQSGQKREGWGWFVPAPAGLSITTAFGSVTEQSPAKWVDLAS